MVGCLAGWLADAWLVGWLTGLPGWLLADWLAAHWLASWLAGCVTGRLLAGWPHKPERRASRPDQGRPHPLDAHISLYEIYKKYMKIHKCLERLRPSPPPPPPATLVPPPGPTAHSYHVLNLFSLRSRGHIHHSHGGYQ